MSMRIVLFLLAALLMAAHFFRSGNFLLVALCLALPLLFLRKRRSSLLLLQLAAYCAGASWLGAMITLIDLRQQTGRPWTAAAIILGTVALFTLVAGLLLNSRGMRERYPLSSSG